MPDSFSPPSAVRSAALRGLRLRQRYGRGGLDNRQASEQGIGSGVQRAADLANGRSLSLETIGRMVGFFARHAKNWQPDKREPDGGPTAGTIAHYLWGGPAGQAWAESVHRQYGQRQKELHRFQSTQVQADDEVAGRVRIMQRAFAPEDLADDGIETDIHVTVFYGLEAGVTAEQVAEVVRSFSPFTIRFTGVSLFERPEYDVVKVDVESGDLEEMHARLGKLPNGNEWQVYKPHLTLAYVKPGAGQRYLLNPLDGVTMRVSYMVFSDREGKKTAIPFLGQRQKAAPVSFTVFKQADGRYRWVARSSNAFRDRDGEIVSTKALADDVERADRTKEYGPLRFWHMPGVDVGDCDFNWLRGRTLIESGTFRDPYVAQRIAEKSADYQVSIGFRHPHGEPDKNGVFHQIERFERSLVPAGRAANPFTSFDVIKEKQHMNDNMKVAALKALLEGDDGRLQALLAGATSAEKTADAMGVQFKEKVDLNALTPDQLLDYAITAKEKQMAEETAAEKPAPAAEEDGDVVTKMTACTNKMDALVTKMGDYAAKMMGESKKEANGLTAVTVATNAHSDRIAQLESQLAQRTKELSDLAAQVSALKSEVPAGVGVGVRPSESDETVVTGEAVKEVGGSVGQLDGFLNFLTGHNGVGG